MIKWISILSHGLLRNMLLWQDTWRWLGQHKLKKIIIETIS